MEHVVQPARPPLSTFVECFWFIREAEDRAVMTPHRVIPDGRIELIINLGHPHRLYHSESLESFDVHRTAWLAGIRRDYIFIAPTVCTHMVGVRFRPGGLAPFFPGPASEVTHEVLELDLLWRRVVEETRERILATEAVEARFRLLEGMLLELAGPWPEADEGVLHCLRTIRARRGRVEVAALADELGIGNRQLRRRFRRVVGLGPKALARIVRFQGLVGRLEETAGRPDWIDLALASGYYDQAHMIRDFRELAGLSPTAYLEARGEHLNFVPVE